MDGVEKNFHANHSKNVSRQSKKKKSSTFSILIISYLFVGRIVSRIIFSLLRYLFINAFQFWHFAVILVFVLFFCCGFVTLREVFLLFRFQGLVFYFIYLFACSVYLYRFSFGLLVRFSVTIF